MDQPLNFSSPWALFLQQSFLDKRSPDVSVLSSAPSPHLSLLARDLHLYAFQTQYVQTGFKVSVKPVLFFPQIPGEKSKSSLWFSPLSQLPHLITMLYIFLHIPTLTHCLLSELFQIPHVDSSTYPQSLSLLTPKISYILLPK